MNLSKPLRSVSRLLHILFLKCRFWLPPQKSYTFLGTSKTGQPGIGSIFVINLDRQTTRWTDMTHELDCVLDAAGKPLSERAVRFSACDAKAEHPEFLDHTHIDPFYSLGDQLFVEPQPTAVPEKFDLEQPIKMSQAEIAVASSHINVWKTIAQSNDSYAMVLEDDTWFHGSFGRLLDKAWREMEESNQSKPKFDILYASYEEVRHGAPKEQLSKSVFCPERGLWFLSGYVLSKEGAQALIDLLPCRGPIDLWINHKFRALKVRALHRPVINQRRDLHSTNSYSILPALSRIGILNGGDTELFHRRPTHSPVFAFGAPGTGLSSLSMALSMLGYRCCSDFDDIPKSEFESIKAGSTNGVFNAYINIGSLRSQLSMLRQSYPSAKYIVIEDRQTSRGLGDNNLVNALEGADVLRMDSERIGNWRAICEHLKLAPPAAEYPVLRDIGQRILRRSIPNMEKVDSVKRLQHDPSPWIIKTRFGWSGISVVRSEGQETLASLPLKFEDDFAQIRTERWIQRNDTFPGNLGLFRSANITPAVGGGISLSVHEQPLGVRNLAAAAISSRSDFLFGRFEATLRATNVPGLVTGFFLHRDSPRQEIDVEILGNQPHQLLVNVFYNPGDAGAKFDYGYRGTPVVIELGFDASKAFHKFAIEWRPSEIKWFVDGKLVHRRCIWNPTPIPHLPMTLHMNTWPSRSRELAGPLAHSRLPASAVVRRIIVDGSLV